MLHHFAVPSFSSSGTLPVKVMKATGFYDMVADAGVTPTAADWSSLTQSPASVPLGIETFVVLKAGVGDLPPIVGYAWGGIWQKATVLAQQVLLLPVQYDSEVTAQTLSITDGVTDTDISVTARDVVRTVGVFSISAAYQNTLYSIGGQLVAFEGMGMNGVASVTDSESNDLAIYAIDDSWLVVEMAEITTPGSITLSFKDSGGTVLGTHVVSVSDANELSGEAFYWYDRDYITVSVDDTDYNAAFIEYGGNTYGPSQGENGLITTLNLRENSFTRIMRDKKGAILAFCNYSVMSVTGSTLFTGRADENGIISLSLSVLPRQFIIRYDSFQVPLRQEFVAW